MKIKVQEDTPITLELRPSFLRALVRATRDDEAGDDAVQDLAQLLRHSDTDGRAEDLADTFCDFAWDRTDEREERELQRRVEIGPWSDNQRQFIDEARALDLRVFLYSGRGMDGTECPAVSGDVCCGMFQAGTFGDALGVGSVVYARG